MKEDVYIQLLKDALDKLRIDGSGMTFEEFKGKYFGDTGLVAKFYVLWMLLPFYLS